MRDGVATWVRVSASRADCANPCPLSFINDTLLQGYVPK
jgi:hypothetical protein